MSRSSCQFLIGNVIHKEDCQKQRLQERCQFLIGNVIHHLSDLAANEKVELCQFLIGNVILMALWSISLFNGYFVSIPYR